jgi:A/G-specific adenine glycosylase
MLQQTQVATVVPYYHDFSRRFPTFAHSLERPSIECSSTGAASAITGARITCTRQRRRPLVVARGRVSARRATIATLPGIGRLTAAAIAAFAFGAQGAILDGNVRRGSRASRRCGVGRRGEGRDGTWTIAESSVPKDDIEIYTQVLMDLGATVCTDDATLRRMSVVADDCALRRSRR